MHIILTAEQEAQLSQLAVQEGKAKEVLAYEIFSRGLAAESHFRDAVELGREAARRGDFVDPLEVWAGVEEALQS